MTTQQVVVGTKNMDSSLFLDQFRKVDAYFLPCELPKSKIFLRMSGNKVLVAHQVQQDLYLCYQLSLAIFDFLYDLGRTEIAQDSMKNLLDRLCRITPDDLAFKEAIHFGPRRAPYGVQEFLNWQWSHLTSTN